MTRPPGLPLPLVLLISLMFLTTPLSRGAPAPPARGPIYDFDILTDQDSYDANVSDPDAPSATVLVTVKNNSTAPLLPINVQLSVNINLGGTATVEPSLVGPILYQGTATAVVTVKLPEDTSTLLWATLTIEGVCKQNSQEIHKQVLLSVRQWHSLHLQNVSLSSSSPVEKELVQISAKVRNLGNGPTYVRVGAYLDGRRLQARLDGGEVDENASFKVDPGKFLLLSATWRASYGHHNFLLEALDMGANGTNESAPILRDSRMVSFFVGINFKDWVPYLMILAVVLAAVGTVAIKYRKRLARRFPRFGRAMHVKLPPPGPGTVRLRGTLKAGVKRARGAAQRVGRRPLPRYVSGRVRSDIDKIRARVVPKGPPPGPEQVEKMKPPEGRGWR